MNRFSPAIVCCALALGLSATLFACSCGAKQAIAPVSVAQAASASTLMQEVEITLRPVKGGVVCTQKALFSVDSKQPGAIDLTWTGDKFNAKTAAGRTVFDYEPGVTRQSSRPQNFSVEVKNSVVEQSAGSQTRTSWNRLQTVNVQRGTPAKNLL